MKSGSDCSDSTKIFRQKWIRFSRSGAAKAAPLLFSFTHIFHSDFFYGLTLYDFQKRHRQSVNSHSEQLKKICSIYRSPCCGAFPVFSSFKVYFKTNSSKSTSVRLPPPPFNSHFPIEIKAGICYYEYRGNCTEPRRSAIY